VKPDVVLLDVEMPKMDGLQCLAEIRRRWPAVRVVMFSTLTTRAAAATLDALSLGASDYVPKPQGLRDPAEGSAYVRDEVVPRILALCSQAVPASATEGLRPPARRPATAALPQRTAVPGRVDVMAIGASTGGPNALTRLLAGLPASLPVPVVVVQHMPPLFTRLLAERLSAKSSLRVREAADGDLLAPGDVLIAPGDLHMTVEDTGAAHRVRTFYGPPENSCRPSVDPLFRSVAQTFGRHALGVVLTGMGRDGLRGAETIRGVGGQIVAQDEATSVVWGMPGFVAGAGLADAVVSIQDMAREVMGRVALQRAATQLAQSAER
jgi:two-component system, chemotaxis family, protein-glutamate methylesterase/glutaminase